MKLTQERLKELLKYDQDTGIFTWRVQAGGRKPGDIAGGINNRGYCRICIDAQKYSAHRLAWLYIHGYFPEHYIDHINRKTADNRLCNLREVTPSCNNKNCKVFSNNKSGITGVYWLGRIKKWSTYIIVDKVYHHLGVYADLTAAVKARHKAEVKFKWPGCNSSTAAFRYLEGLRE